MHRLRSLQIALSSSIWVAEASSRRLGQPAQPFTPPCGDPAVMLAAVRASQRLRAGSRLAAALPAAGTALEAQQLSIRCPGRPSAALMALGQRPASQIRAQGACTPPCCCAVPLPPPLAAPTCAGRSPLLAGNSRTQPRSPTSPRTCWTSRLRAAAAWMCCMTRWVVGMGGLFQSACGHGKEPPPRCDASHALDLHTCAACAHPHAASARQYRCSWRTFSKRTAHSPVERNCERLHLPSQLIALHMPLLISAHARCSARAPRTRWWSGHDTAPQLLSTD